MPAKRAKSSRRTSRKAAYAATTGRGGCGRCRKPKRLCVCAPTIKTKRAAKTAAGLCNRVGCKNKKLDAAASCEEHWFATRAGSFCGDQKRGPDLQKKFTGICSLFGDPIGLDASTQADHIVPRWMGGSSDPANLQWVSKAANAMKGGFTMAELYDNAWKLITTAARKMTAAERIILLDQRIAGLFRILES